ncbi:MAG: hypothetical protein ABIW84_09845 [Ilumatobacteraceae bacterium]
MAVGRVEGDHRENPIEALAGDLVNRPNGLRRAGEARQQRLIRRYVRGPEPVHLDAGLAQPCTPGSETFRRHNGHLLVGVRPEALDKEVHELKVRRAAR